MSAVSIASRDLDEARSFGGSAYYPHTLACVGDDSEFAMRLRSLTVGPLMAGVLSYDVEVHIETTHELATAYEVNIPLAGELDCWVGGRHTVGTPNRAVVNGPSHRSTLHGFGRDRPLFGLKVQRDALEAQYDVLHGRPARRSLDLSPHIELDGALGRRWWTLARVLLEAIDEPDGLLGNPMVARPLVDAVLRGLLIVGTEPTDGTARESGPASLRAAIDYLRANASDPLTVADIAAAGGCSVRALQEGFRRRLATTPMAYLEGVRLAGAHADLLAADAARETVNDVAWRWGFTHAGRFAATYRRHYGVRPFQTLRA
jgi:AraC-like DNA-binding protein